jgi:DNA-binding NtrC family response regulator
MLRWVLRRLLRVDDIVAMKRGAYDYLTKPFHIPELEILLEKAYEKARLA